MVLRKIRRMVQRLESRLVSSEHEKFLEDLLASSDLLFLAFFGLGLEVLACSSFCDDKVSVTLSFELTVSIFKVVSWTDYDSWHNGHPLPYQYFPGRNRHCPVSQKR